MRIEANWSDDLQVSWAGAYGRTALMEMIRARGKKWPVPIAELLKKSVNEQDSAGMTALMFAAKGAGVFGSRRGNLTLIKQLIDFGARLDIQTEKGLTVVGIAHASNLESKARTNDDVVSFLKDATIKDRAMREFHATNRCTFDTNGVLVLESR